MLRWKMAEMIGYTPITTFWTDFSIADVYGVSGIQDTFDRAFEHWKGDYKYLTELVMVLNHKIWEWYDLDEERAELYDKLWRQAADYATKNLKGDELRYYYETTD